MRALAHSCARNWLYSGLPTGYAELEVPQSQPYQRLGCSVAPQASCGYTARPPVLQPICAHSGVPVSTCEFEQAVSASAPANMLMVFIIIHTVYDHSHGLSTLIFSNKYDMNTRRSPMSTLRNINLNLEIGQTILVGPNKKPAEITKIEFHEQSGEITLNTTRGPRKALTFSLAPGQDDSTENPADRYR